MSVDEVLGENLADSLTAFAALAAAVVSLIATSYWDSGTTIELRSVSVLLSIALTSIPSGGWITFHWFRRRPWLVAPPQWNLKHDSPGVWALTGIAAGVALAVLVGWTTFAFVGVLAQHAGGHYSRVTARVLAVERLSGRYRVCDLRAVFAVDWAKSIDACVVPRSGSAIARYPIKVGDTVVLTVTENALGSVLSGVRPASSGPQ